MLLIISSTDDLSTNEVIDWISHFNIDYIRISSKDELTIHKLQYSNFGLELVFSIKGKVYKWDEIKAVWYRRSYIKTPLYKINSNIDEELDWTTNFQLESENKILIEAFWEILKKKSLNSEEGNKLNKLETLNLCTQIGINIPDTLVTHSKFELNKFYQKHKFKVITKNLSPGVFINNQYGRISTATQVLTSEMVENRDDFFSPILVQQNIEKAFELRVFYILGECYANAIFSQNDEKTKIDFRNYNWEKPNRTPPYFLPEKITKKIIQLMNLIQLNSGSIDFLVDIKGDYYFLEVNPVGQFKQVSYPSNYYLEKIIANHLINYESKI